jgi:X-Pro dipeptidyl-peptidase
VYVETEYDTDSDGKRDLIEVFLQIPRAALEGGYKAPVILLANPYEHNPVNHPSPTPADGYDMSRIYSQPAVRTPVGSVSAWDAAMAAKPSDWHYDDPEHRYRDHTQNDYFLLRGYATATCGLLGSYGSEGYACTGLDLELLAVKSVIEWFNGDAVGYTSRDSLVTTAADWCSGSVGMTGISYLGTMEVGVAAMGIDNLRTVIPACAIANWYEYVYQKGGMINQDTLNPYIPYLAAFISTGKDPETGDYLKFLQKIAYDEKALYGQYTDGTSGYWIKRDYTKMDVDTDTSVLLVHGLNDLNVRTVEFERIHDMFADSGVTVKSILHQGAHQLPVGKHVFDLGDSNGLDTMNRWMSQYLFGQDAGVEQWPDYQVQSNLDGSWSGYGSLEPASQVGFVSHEGGTKTFYSDVPDDIGVMIDLGTADSDMTVLGGEVRVRMACDAAGIPDQPLTVLIFDSYEPGMKAYLNLDESNVEIQSVPLSDPERDLIWQGSGMPAQSRYQFVLSDTTSKTFTRGTVGMDYHGETEDLDSMRLKEREPGTYYEYVIDLLPSVYELKKGHTLSVYITAYDPYMAEDLGEYMVHYGVTVDLSSLEVNLDLLR